jgi:hypothetical protein
VAGEAGEVRRIAGLRRVLGVAMDNAVDLPGYKHYLDPRDGSRPAVMVAFADLVEAPGGGGPSVNGVLVPAADLAGLDRRERNYDRVDVTDRVADPPPGRVWAYLGSASGRERFAIGPTVVARAYVEAVQAGFRALGAAEHRAFLASTDFGGVPVVALERVDLP